MGYIYVKSSIQDRKENLFKVGRTNQSFHSLYKRYGTSTPNLEINFCAWFDDEVKIELLVHQQLKKYKIEGQGVEHFQCPLHIIVDVINDYLRPSKVNRMLPRKTEFNFQNDWITYDVPCFNYRWIKQNQKFEDKIRKVNDQKITIQSKQNRWFINQLDMKVESSIDELCRYLQSRFDIRSIKDLDTFIMTQLDDVETMKHVQKQLDDVNWNKLYILCLNRDVVSYVRPKIDDHFIVEHKGQQYAIKDGNFDFKFMKVVNNLKFDNFKIVKKQMNISPQQFGDQHFKEEQRFAKELKPSFKVETSDRNVLEKRKRSLKQSNSKEEQNNQCKGYTKQNKRCKNSGDYCHLHEGQRGQCLGLTSKNERCTKKVKEGQWCHHHIKDKKPFYDKLKHRSSLIEKRLQQPNIYSIVKHVQDQSIYTNRYLKNDPRFFETLKQFKYLKDSYLDQIFNEQGLVSAKVPTNIFGRRTNVTHFKFDFINEDIQLYCGLIKNDHLEDRWFKQKFEKIQYQFYSCGSLDVTGRRYELEQSMIDYKTFEQVLSLLSLDISSTPIVNDELLIELSCIQSFYNFDAAQVIRGYWDNQWLFNNMIKCKTNIQVIVKFIQKNNIKLKNHSLTIDNGEPKIDKYPIRNIQHDYNIPNEILKERCGWSNCTKSVLLVGCFGEEYGSLLNKFWLHNGVLIE